MTIITPTEALQRTIEHREIFHDEMLHLMRMIMNGEITPLMTAAILTGLRVKKETIGEIAAAATVMREFATQVTVPDVPELIDTCGTGGDSAHTFNVSTTAMFVAAAAGAKIAKHGGRSVSSKSGSADVLELLGANINLKPEAVAQSIAETGIGFMFAPNHHSAMKQQVMGVFHSDLVGIQARVLHRLGSRRVMIVHGLEGLDELSISGPTAVGELKDGAVREYMVAPADVGLKTHNNAAIRVDGVEQSRDMMLGALDNKDGAARDIVALNAGASIYIAGKSPTLVDGVQQALAAIASGAARKKLDQFIAFTQSHG